MNNLAITAFPRRSAQKATKTAPMSTSCCRTCREVTWWMLRRADWSSAWHVLSASVNSRFNQVQCTMHALIHNHVPTNVRGVAKLSLKKEIEIYTGTLESALVNNSSMPISKDGTIEEFLQSWKSIEKNWRKICDKTFWLPNCQYIDILQSVSLCI